MGITFHFEGQLQKDQLPTALQQARQFAERNKWPFVEIPEEERMLSRVRDEKDWDHLGVTLGIEIYPDENCEPLRLEFDKVGFIQEYVKTQFSPLTIHVSIVKLLRELGPWFVHLEVVD